MDKNVYITKLSSFLPNEPVENDEMEDSLGYIGMRYYYTTNDVNHSQNCWIAINWADASTFESIIGW